MTKRRSRGDGGLHWDEKRQRWIATASLGFDPAGKRIVKRGSGQTKTEAKEKLKEVLRDFEDGLPIVPNNYTVADAVNDWLSFGLTTQTEATVRTLRFIAEKHVIPDLGARKIWALTAEDVDRWLAKKAKTYSTATVRRMHACLNRALKRAMAGQGEAEYRRPVRHSPGTHGTPVQALTFAQADRAQGCGVSRMRAYVVCLLTGARTGARSHGEPVTSRNPDAQPPIRRISPCGGPSREETPRPGSHAGPWPCPPGASRPWNGSAPHRPKIG
jgi:hypothetical protein